MEGYVLTYQAALIGALVSGIFDHFFFNINFIHLVSIFWLVMGMGMVAAQLTREPRLSVTLPCGDS